MAKSTTEYLDGLGSGRHEDLPETTSGTVRLDVVENGRTEHWYVTIDRQDVRVTRSPDDAELVIRAEREVFDRLTSGRTHIVASLLRNELTVQGNLRLMMTMRRLFPGPAGARHPRELAPVHRDGAEPRR